MGYTLHKDLFVSRTLSLGSVFSVLFLTQGHLLKAYESFFLLLLFEGECSSETVRTSPLCLFLLSPILFNFGVNYLLPEVMLFVKWKQLWSLNGKSYNYLRKHKGQIDLNFKGKVHPKMNKNILKNSRLFT